MSRFPAEFQPDDLPLGFLVNTFGRLLFEETAAALRPLGIEPALLGILWFVDLAPGCAQAQHARFQKRDATTFGRYVDELERRGWLVRAPIPGDRRAHALEITDSGRRVLSEGKARAQGVEARFVTTLDGGLTGLKVELLRLLTAEWPRP